MVQQPNSWIKTTCAYCGVGCGIEAKPLANGLLSIRGDDSHPANYGKLCSKGLALGETVVETGRLKYPMLAGEVTQWQPALSHVAQQFKATIDKYGKDSVAFYVSGQLLTEDYYVANKLMKGFIGSGNIDTNSRLCMSSSVAGHKRAFGSDTVPGCYEDIDHADMIILVGSNLAWCHPTLYQRIKHRKQHNPKLTLVVIDPRKTASCDIADLHLAITPGSDVALFNGLLSYLVDQGKIDANYIAQHTEHFDSTLKVAQATSTQTLVDKTGIALEQLTHFYQLFADTNKVMTLYSQGVNQSSQGTDKVNSIINCHLATAKIGRPGACPFSITGQPNAMGGREVGGLANTLAAHMDFDNSEHHQLISDYWQTQQLASKPGLKAVELFDAIDAGKVKAVWIMATNPVNSLPDADKIRSALEKCPFVVVSDCIEDTDTCRMADVLLPAQGWAEKSGTVTNSERRISRQRRLMATPGEGKPDWWIISEIAKRMGFSDAFTYQSEADIFKEYAQMTSLGNNNATPRDLDLSGLSQLTIEQYHQLSPQQWPVTSAPAEHTAQTLDVHQRMFSDGQFFTPSRKAQFVAVHHHASKHQVSADYPLLLNTGRIRDQWHTMTRSGLSARLCGTQAQATLLIHPHDAEQYQLQQGDISRVSSIKGEINIRVEVSTQVQAGQVFAPIHWSDTNASDAKACRLIDSNTDPISGQPELKQMPVKICRLDYTCHALVLSPHPITTADFDFWVKQTVASGYLYHIASHSTAETLEAQLQQQLRQHAQQIAETDLHYSSPDKLFFRALQLQNQKVLNGYVIAPVIEAEHFSWFEDLLTKPLNSHISLSVYSGQPQGELAKGKLICACKQVGKTTLCNSINQHGLTELTQVTEHTQAGSGCGSCLPEVELILDEQLALRDVAVPA